MKLLTLTCVLSLFLIQQLKSQDTLYKPVYYKSKVYVPNPISGYLATIQDSALFLTPSKIPYSSSNIPVNFLQKVDFRSISSVMVVKSGVRTRSILISMAIGCVAGSIIGYAQGDDSGWFATTAGEKAVAGALI